MSKELIITVFGSSRPQEGEAEYEEARILGSELSKAGFAVCSGGYGGVMEAVSRGVKGEGGKTYGVTTEFFAAARANVWIDVEIKVKTWQERLFELIKLGDGFVACKGGTGTLVELAVTWEMMNKSVMPAKPLAVMGDFWSPMIESVRQVELGHAGRWGEAQERLVYAAKTPGEAAGYLVGRLRNK